MNEVKKSQKQTLSGSVEKTSSENTVKIVIKTTKVHPIYKKRYTLLRRHTAHYADMELNVGDKVTIEACKPISKLKHWVVINRLTQA